MTHNTTKYTVFVFCNICEFAVPLEFVSWDLEYQNTIWERISASLRKSFGQNRQTLRRPKNLFFHGASHPLTEHLLLVSFPYNSTCYHFVSTLITRFIPPFFFRIIIFETLVIKAKTKRFSRPTAYVISLEYKSNISDILKWTLLLCVLLHSSSCASTIFKTHWTISFIGKLFLIKYILIFHLIK